MPGIYRLKGTVKHYDWGGTACIPSLLKERNTDNKPFAEYWMGVHPLGISLVETGNGQSKKLTEYIDALPYLFKILDVKDMLSIQVHPSKADAAIEFARENKEGIPLDSPQRSYKDDNHKPELMAALGDFWLLHGFKPVKELEHILQNVAALRELLPVYNTSGYAGLYRHVMEMPQPEVDRILRPLLNTIIPLYKEGKLDKTSADFWAARAALTFSHQGHVDRGIFSVYLFNLVHLKKGEAIFQDAGVPHAYLEGQNVEIMANSDNVLRGGLTTKFIDVKEVLKHIKCEPTIVNILTGDKKGHSVVYKTIAPDFELSAYDLKAGESVSLAASATEILVAVTGSVELRENADVVALGSGSPSGIIFPGHTAQLVAKESSLVFKAGLPAADVNK